MKLIAACDRKWGIGKDGKLLVSIPSDMKRFKEFTLGKVIIAGRKTVDTFPGGLALPERTNIILSKDPAYKLKDATVVHDLEELKTALKSNAEDLNRISTFLTNAANAMEKADREAKAKIR